MTPAIPLDIAGRQLRAARDRLTRATDTACTAALTALAEGTAEAEVARTLGVDRMTVRKWAGKR